jgi:hypothetical protein
MPANKPVAWIMHHDCDLTYLGKFLYENDPRPAKVQLDERYVGGFMSFPDFELVDGCMVYPGDPPMRPIAEAMLRHERIVLYEGEWVAIIQPDNSFEIARMS